MYAADKHILAKFNRERKQSDMKNWQYDIDSYYRMKKMRDLAIKSGRNTDFHDNYIQKIKNRWPMVKNWP